MNRLCLVLLFLGSTAPAPAQVGGASLGKHAPAREAAAVPQLIRLDPTGTFLVSGQTGKPVFLSGDSSFNLAVQLSSSEELERYFTDRQAKGINIAWVGLVDNVYHDEHPPHVDADAFGNSPWNDGPPFTGMTSGSAVAYWKHIDYVVQRAAAHGIIILANPAFAGCYWHCAAAGGYGVAMKAASDARLRDYGAFLGSRYRAYPNIMWLLGGDSDIGHEGTALQTKQADIAAGILSQDPNHLIVVEEVSDDSTSNTTWTWWHGYPWFRVNTIYPKPGGWSPLHTLLDILAQTTDAVHHGLPFFSIEDVYETEGGINNHQLRQEAYYEILNGGYLGRVFGSLAIWPFNSQCCEAKGYTWQADLDAQPSRDQALVGELFRSREFWKLRPDFSHQVLTDGIGAGVAVSLAACTTDGQTCIVYDPIGSVQPPEIAMSHFTGPVQAWWFDPDSAHQRAAIRIGSFSNIGKHTFRPPDKGDWVLVLDLASAGLGAP